MTRPPDKPADVHSGRHKGRALLHTDSGLTAEQVENGKLARYDASVKR